MISVVMGSYSDWDRMADAVEILKEFKVPNEYLIISAHRTPDLLFKYAEEARDRGIYAIIAGAGGSAHLPGMLASKTSVPILAVPMTSRLIGIDSLLSMISMPDGIPNAVFPIDGAKNAALFAIAMLANTDEIIRKKLDEYRTQQTKKVLETQLRW